MSNLPETILQFGAGKFIRSFADLFIHQANEQGQAVGRIVVAQTTGDGRAGLLNKQGGRYHVVIRGLENGVPVERVEEVGSVRRALVAAREWDDLRDFARWRRLRYILSNTTEAGYDLDPTDRPNNKAPRSFPGKLVMLLKDRFDAGLAGVTIIPCELLEHNADKLLAVTLQLAESWDMPAGFRAWLQHECVWLNTLVDRIVAATPEDHPLHATDGLLTAAEPFAFWAIQERPKAAPFVQHPAIVRAPDIQPYFLRKVRILNGAHTALVCKARPRGFLTVRQAVEDPELGAWLHRLLFEEIVPTLEGRVEGSEHFARQTLERFRNPFLEHKLSDIALHHKTKLQVRLVPTRAEFVERFGRTPPLLDEVLSGEGEPGA
jgi:tagaturonate reductase